MTNSTFGLTRLGAATYVAALHVRVGVWAPAGAGGRALLVDVGIDDDAAKKLARLLGENGLRPAALVLTHHHADHAGGAAWLKKAFQCRVFATPIERALIENPVLEPFYLYGAYPPPSMRNRFLQARACEVDWAPPVTAEPGALADLFKEGDEAGDKSGNESRDEPGALFDGLRLISLPGHSPGQAGLLTPDGVLFSGDAFFGGDVMAKYAIPYHADVMRALQTIDFLQGRAGAGESETALSCLVPAHGEPLSPAEAVPVLEANRARLLELEDIALRALGAGPKTREELLGALVEVFPTELNSSQYHLLYSGLGALLADLLEKRRVKMRFTDRALLWEEA